MPMFTVHADYPNPEIRRSGSFWTIRWDSGLAIQLDEHEWTALVDAITATTALTTVVDHARVITRDEDTVRAAAEIRESL